VSYDAHHIGAQFEPDTFPEGVSRRYG